MQKKQKWTKKVFTYSCSSQTWNIKQTNWKLGKRKNLYLFPTRSSSLPIILHFSLREDADRNLNNNQYYVRLGRERIPEWKPSVYAEFFNVICNKDYWKTKVQSNHIPRNYTRSNINPITSNFFFKLLTH